VETRERLDLVRRLGCTDAQGFFYSEPLTPETYAQALSKIAPKGRQ